jgi:predicted alpha/beta superfamily hydrolase
MVIKHWCAVMALVITGLALAPAPSALAETVVLPNAEYRDIAPLRGGPPWRVFIWKPKAPPPEAGYPVIYVTDANAVFGTLVEALNMRSRNPAVSGVDPAVIVGIGYPTDQPLDLDRRTYDLTPKVDVSTLPPKPDNSPWAKTGGADEFLAFIQDEVKPLIAKEVKIDPARESLFGHSFGGLFALHVLFTKPEAFDVYVAGSPSIWFGDRHLMKEAGAFIASAKTKPVNVRLLLAVGEWEQVLSPAEAKGPKPEVRANWKAKNRMLDNARDMDAELKEASGLSVTYREFSEEDHVSIIPVIAARALSFAAAPVR